jgi:hypothetical protein
MQNYKPNDWVKTAVMFIMNAILNSEDGSSFLQNVYGFISD